VPIFLKGDDMPRPKGSKDKVKRKRKNILDGNTERKLIQDYADGVAPYEIKKKYNISKAALSVLLKTRNVKVRLNRSDINKWNIIEDIEKLDKNISGIYAIVFEWIIDDKFDYWDSNQSFKFNDIKAYIGSSVCIKSRIKEHLKQLKDENHYNVKLTDYAASSSYKMRLAIIETCQEKELLQREGAILRSINDISLINKNVVVDSKDIEPWLKKAIVHEAYASNYYHDKNKSYNGSLCKCSSYISKDGYGKLQVTVGEETKYLIKHRVAYWEKHKEYPELVRHLCNNKACYNPDHLAKGSHRENGLDKRGNFAKEFENIWLKYRGNLLQISAYYSHKWAANQKWKGHNVSYAVYSWEKKLNLVTKYPSIVKARRSRATL
jgi:hypothetical protein